MSRLILLLSLLFAVPVHAEDTPADPALADIKVMIIEQAPYAIAEQGHKEGLVSQYALNPDEYTVLAYSWIEADTCYVVVPSAALVSVLRWQKLVTHELRHCHGENHPGTNHFADEGDFNSTEF